MNIISNKLYLNITFIRMKKAEGNFFVQQLSFGLSL